MHGPVENLRVKGYLDKCMNLKVKQLAASRVIPCQINRFSDNFPPHHHRIVPKKYMLPYALKMAYPENFNLIGQISQIWRRFKVLSFSSDLWSFFSITHRDVFK
jgi:hypothetical protein